MPDKMASEYYAIRSNRGDTFAYCVICSVDISIVNRATDF